MASEWTFERVTEAYPGVTGGVVWDGGAVLFAQTDADRIVRYDPRTGKTVDVRKYTNRTHGLAFSPSGELFGCQQLSRRIVRFNADGTTSPMTYRFPDGGYHNMPYDVAIDRRSRIWFSDPMHALPARGPGRPHPNHQSVLRLDQLPDRSWVLGRLTHDTRRPTGILVSADQGTLYVADAGDDRAELRAYPIRADGTLGDHVVLHTWGADHRGRHRGADGMCLDADGNIVACAGSPASGPGPMVYVFSPTGRVLETHPAPVEPIGCAFGDADLTTLYVTTRDGGLHRVQKSGRKGWLLWPAAA
jgi:gluconolactonase